MGIFNDISLIQNYCSLIERTCILIGELFRKLCLECLDYWKLLEDVRWWREDQHKNQNSNRALWRDMCWQIIYHRIL